MVEPDQRVTVKPLSGGVTRIVLNFGFMQQPLLAQSVQDAIARNELSCGDSDPTSYYIGRETIIPTTHIPGMWVWRESVYAFMQRNAERSAAYFGIPTAQVVEIGIEIEI